MWKGSRISIMSLMFLLALTVQVRAEIAATTYGGTLANGGDYEWYYGCSPTSAGMLMAYYDRNGYDGLFYDNLVPGGVAETTSFPTTGPSHLVANTIASSDHVADFWVGDGQSGNDPLVSGRTRPDDFNCLADFMGTSQDGLSPHLDNDNGNTDGGTSFWHNGTGSPFTYTAMEGWGEDYYNASGMYGIYEYVAYAGYDVASLYNQNTDNRPSGGFSFSDAKAEIDAGRPFLVHIRNDVTLVGHTMLGYGYDDPTNTLYIHDTWTEDQHSMTWGSSYSGMTLSSVTVMELTGGSEVPEPSTLAGLMSLAVVGLVLVRRNRRRVA